MQQKINKILIYGGVFNPPHLGHLKILTNASELLMPDLVIIIVDKIPPWKQTTDLVPFEYRKKMVTNLFNNRDLPYIIFENKDNLVYSSDIVDEIANEYKGSIIYFLLGQDQYDQLDKWNSINQLNEKCTIVCHKRSDEDIKLSNNKHIIINQPYIDCCSKNIKENLSKKYLDDINFKYIEEFKLYLIYKIKSAFTEYRYLHTMRVLDTINLIADGNNFSDFEKWQCQIAATLHDIAKLYTDEQLKEKLTKDEMADLPSLHCGHGIVGAKIAKEEYDIKDKSILEAIANHVIYKDTDNKIAQALYCADKLEPARTSRDIKDREKLLELAVKNLSKSIEKIIDLNEGKYQC